MFLWWSVHESFYRWRLNVRGKVRLSRRMKTSIGHGRCTGTALEKGAHEQTVMRSWMTCGRREMMLNALMVLGVFRWDATLRWVGAEEPTEVTNRMTMWTIDEAWLWRVCRPEDDAWSMVRTMAVLAIDAMTGQWVVLVRSIVNGGWQPTCNSESCQKAY